jgi:hypothetical protein
MRQLQDACLGRGLSGPIVPDGKRKFMQKYPDSPYGIVFAKDAVGEVECCNRKVRFMDWQYAEDLEYLRSVE